MHHVSDSDALYIIFDSIFISVEGAVGVVIEWYVNVLLPVR